MDLLFLNRAGDDMKKQAPGFSARASSASSISTRSQPLEMSEFDRLTKPAASQSKKGSMQCNQLQSSYKIYLSVCLSIYLSVSASVSVSISISISIDLSISLNVYMPVCIFSSFSCAISTVCATGVPLLVDGTGPTKPLEKSLLSHCPG